MTDKTGKEMRVDDKFETVSAQSASVLKKKGNDAYGNGRYEEAISFYSEALKFETNNHILYSNRSLAHVKLQSWQKSLDDANASIKLCNSFAKPWFTKAKAEFCLNHSDEAIESYVNGLAIEPNYEEGLKILTDLVLSKMMHFQRPDVDAGDYLRERLQGIPLPSTIPSWTVESTSKQQAICADALSRFEGNSMELYVSLAHLALTFQAQSNYVLALSCHMSSLWILEKVDISSHKLLISIKHKFCLTGLHNIGLIFYKLGKRTAAHHTFRRALTLIETLENEPSTEQIDSQFFVKKAEILTHYGFLLATEGQYSEGLRTLREALALSERYDASDAGAFACYCLGAVYRHLGEDEEAIKHNEQGIKLSEKTENSPVMALNLSGLGLCYMDQGNYEEAVRLVEKSIETDRSEHNKMNQHKNLGRIYNEIFEVPPGSVANFLQQFPAALEKAEFHYKKAFEIAKKINAVDNMSMLQFYLGFVADKKFSPKDAEQHFRSGLALAEQTNMVYTLAGGHYGLGHALLKQDRIDEAIASFVNAEKLLGNLWNTLGEDRFMISWGDTFGPSATNEMLQFAYVRAEKYGTALEVAERGRSRALVEEYAAKIKASSRCQNVRSSLTCAEIQECANKLGVTFIYFSLLKQCDFLLFWIVSGEKISFGISSYAAESKAKHVEAFLPPKILALTENVAEAVRNFATVKRKKRPEHMPDDEAERLYVAIWKRCERWLPSDPNKKIIIIPHDELFSIPFAALIRPDKKRLVSCHTLGMAPSVTWLVYQMAASDAVLVQQPSPETHCFVMGNPSMPKLKELGDELIALPQAQREAETVAMMLNSQAITGYDATKTRAMAQMPNASVIHLATHNILSIPGRHGSSLGAVVFSGNDGAAVDSFGDCLLFPEDIQQLNLSATKLVVLSCCNTGHGRLRAEGLIGLGRAFLFAGAQAVVLSLWNVPDTIYTCRFMEKFYEEYINSGKVAASLRSAMLLLHNEHRPINEWASFCAYGNV